MHEIGQDSVPTSDSDTEMFTSLRLAEPSERVNISLDERMLTIRRAFDAVESGHVVSATAYVNEVFHILVDMP